MFSGTIAEVPDISMSRGPGFESWLGLYGGGVISHLTSPIPRIDVNLLLFLCDSDIVIRHCLWD